MKKKVIKISAIVFLLILGILIAIPFFLENRIGEILRTNVNKNINGTFDFSDADLSLIKSFPNAQLSLKDISLITLAPFEGDTLFSSERLELKMGLGELFKGAGEPIGIRSLTIDNALLNIMVDEAGKSNYDIARETGAADNSTAGTEGFQFDLQSYEIRRSRIRYQDLEGNMKLELLEVDHQGKGDLSLEKSELQTSSSALVSFEMDSTNYLEKNRVNLEALIGIDLETSTYTFLENEAMINQLPLVFDGFVKVNEESQEVSLNFKTPSSDFRNFLALIPEAYSKNIEQVETRGNFEVEGTIKGVVDDEHIPTLNIQIKSDNAYFKYPDLPKAVRDINIDAGIINETGLAEDTYVELRAASFAIDEDKFSVTARITELTGNTKVDAHLTGNMNLANLSQAYPVPDDLNLKGRLRADIRTDFDMASVEQKQYEKTNTSGNLRLEDFQYKPEAMPAPINLSVVALDFNSTLVQLRELRGGVGKTDFNASGSLTNFLGFMFNQEDVEGNFTLSSNNFVLDDFMMEESIGEETGKTTEASATAAPGERIRIPAFLNCSINASANTVVYDNISLRDVKASLLIRDEKAVLTNFTSGLFDGRLALNGEVSTKAEKSVFSMDMDLSGLGIGEAFESLELLRTLAPIAGAMDGKLNSTLKLSGLLNGDFTPDLMSLSGNAVAELLAADLSPEKAELLAALDSKLNFLNLDNLNLKGLKTALNFEDGLVKVKPFAINYQDISLDITGGHTFDQELQYTATIQLPAHYLGQEVNSLIASIDEEQLQNLTIPVKANIGGQYTQPTVSTDLTSGVSHLTSRLVEIHKQKLMAQGKEKARELIGGILSGQEKDSSAQKDSTATDLKNILGGVLGQKTAGKDSSLTKQDTAAPKKDPVKESARDILGGLLGRKKKDSTDNREN